MSAAPASPSSAAPSSAAAVSVQVDAPSALPANGVAAGAAATAGGATPTHASTDASSSDPSPSSPKAADAKGKGGRGGRGKPKEVLPRVPFRQLFRYATGADMLLNTIAAVAAAANGFIFPGFALLFGDLLSQFNTVTSTDEFVAKIDRYALWFLLIAIGAGVTALLENALPMITAERQIRRVREAYVNALLRQEVAFYDTNKAGELASRMIEDTLTMSGGIAEKSFTSIHYSITFLGGIAVGFARSWQLTLVMFGALPVIMVVMAFLTNSVRKFSSNEATAYAKAGDAATEAFSAIRTVAAFGAEEHEVERYDSHLAVAEKNGASKGVWVGAAVGAIFGCIFIFYGLASLVAGVLIVRDREANPACYNPNTPGCFTGGDVVSTLLAVLIGSFSLGQVGPNFSAFASAQVAAYKLYAIIDRVPPIDVQSPAGAKPAPASLAGAIEFRNVTFAYPSRKTEPVLRNFSLAIRGGTTVALVGESGCGKSTLMQLFQRFYDVDEGEVLVDGINVKDWNLAHLRERVGVVSQEPTLFGTSVGENIGYGKPASAGPATQAEIEAAATAANAHEFISRLPEGYGTVVGTSVASTQLSGGQRQRVCIARAILRDPKYLLLDEATSALDTKSERQVEAALAKLLSRDAVTGVRGTRTTLLIAHRLSTVTNADRIVVMHRGEVIEDGNHVSLMGLEGGAYRRLRELQDMAAEAAAASLAAGTDFAAGGPASPRTPAAGTGIDVPAPEHVGVTVATADGGVATPSAGSATSATVMTPAARAPAVVAGAVTVPVDSDPTPSVPTAADGLTIQRAPSIRTDAAALKGTVAAAAAAAPASAADAAKGGKPAAKPAAAAAGPPAAPKEDKEWEREKAKLPPVKMSRVWALQAPEWAYLAVGLLGATLSGITQPVFAIIWSNMIAFFFGPNEQLKDNTRIYVLWFFLLGIAQVLVTIMRIGGFVYAGEKLTRRLRAMAYRAILRQEIGFFEEKGNSVGRLSTRLQADAAEVKGATGEGLSLVFQAGAAVIAGIVIAFQANWRLALVVVAIMPFMVLASLVQGKAFKGYNLGAAKALEESGHIAVESTAAIKTVTAFNLQPQLLQAFSRSLEVPMRAGFGKAYSVGLGQLFQGFMMFSAYALAFYAGGQFIAREWCTFAELMRVYLAVTMSAQAAGNAINWGPSMDKAERATRSVFALLDRKSAVDPMTKEGVTLPAGQRVAGLVELKNVTFAYPTRPDTPAIQNLSLTIRPGQKVALVGPSGSGKSTVIQLLERFYLPSQGQILLDNRPIEGYNVSWLRTQFGLIQQEPSLFADSVRYNIEYGQVGGKPAWDKGAPLEPPKDYMPPADQMDAPPAIVAAAEGANAASFVNASKYRYATHCGTRGNQQLSGGQRQRLCIARVMLRNPPIAFADEATSALDTSSERIVQAAIDRMLRADVVAGAGGAAAGADGTSGARTSIVVAHRLSTIRDADVIFVLDKGRLVEQGTHEELMALPEGLYRSLAVAQGVGETLGSPNAAAEPPVSPSAGAAVTPVAGGAAL